MNKYSIVLGTALIGSLFFSLAQNNQVKATPLSYTYDFKTLDNSMWQEKWAIDNFHGQFTFTPTTEGCYTYSEDDAGSTFVTIGGTKSPGGDGTTTTSAGITGTLSGGMKGIICGTFRDNITNASPEDLTVGSYPSYAVKYFHHFFVDDTIRGFTTTDWGWTFTSCGNGTWTDNDKTETAWQTDKTAMGDIKGEPAACQNPTPIANPQAGKQSSAGIDGKVCSGQNFNAYAVLKLDGNPVKDVNVKFVYNGEAKFAKTQVDGRAGVAYGYANDSDVQYLPEDGYPTQLQKAVKANDCAVIVTAGTTTTGGQVLGASTLAKTGSAEEVFMSIVGFAGAGLTAAGSFLTLKKKI